MKVTSQLILDIKENENAIEHLLEKGDYNQAKKLLDTLNSKTEKFYLLTANYWYSLDEYEAAFETLEDGIKMFRFSYNLYQRLAQLSYEVGDIANAAYFYTKLVKLSDSPETQEKNSATLNVLIGELEALEEQSEELLDFFKLLKQSLIETYELEYPVDRFQESLVRKSVLDSKNEEYMTYLYRPIATVKSQDMVIPRYLLKTELLKGTTTQSYTFKVINEMEKTAVAFGKLDDFAEILIEGPVKSYILEEKDLGNNQFNYFTFKEIGDYKVTSTKPFFISEPQIIPITTKIGKPVITIFVDGLANTLIKDKLEELMPNTYAFFSKGYINQNCYTTGDWTFTSVASMYTGKTVLEHGVYHPNQHCTINEFNKLYTTAFKEAGYITGQINNDWRVTPTYGYLEDMDRIVYQSFRGGYAAGEVIADAIEHIETYKHKNQFLWVSLLDLHDVSDNIHNDIMSQNSIDISHRKGMTLGQQGIQPVYNRDRIICYESELNRIDLHLGSLLRYLELTFGEDNFVVSLVSDHGQTYEKHKYLEEEPKWLSHERRNVPFMIRGKNVPNKESKELSSIVDIFPTMLHLCDIEFNKEESVILKDFGGLGRNETLTETYHPNQPYAVALTTEETVFYFSTVDLVNSSGLVDLSKHWVKLIDKATNEDITANKAELIKIYTDKIVRRALKIQR